MATNLRIEKSPYILSGLTDCHKVWLGDTSWPSESKGS